MSHAAPSNSSRPDLALFIPSYAGGGGERVALFLARSLADAGLRVDLVVACGHGALRDEHLPGVTKVELGALTEILAAPAWGTELQHVVDRLADTLGFSEHQYTAVRHSHTDHEHIHVAINKIHPETFRMHSPAWDHRRLFTEARALELELGLTALRSRARDREKVPQRAADCEAHHGLDSFARWARENLRSALRATELRSWDDFHGAVSSGGCNSVEYLARFHPLKSLSRPRIELPCDSVQIGLSVSTQISGFWKILS